MIAMGSALLLAITGLGWSAQGAHPLSGEGLGQARAFAAGLTDAGVVGSRPDKARMVDPAREEGGQMHARLLDVVWVRTGTTDAQCRPVGPKSRLSLILDLIGLYIRYIVPTCTFQRRAVDVAESRNERFRRIAATRGDRLIREIALLGNLANRKNYEYSPEEVEALFGPIEAELREVRALFDPNSPSTRKVRSSERPPTSVSTSRAAGRAAAQGAIAPAEQFFEGSLAEESLARETGQNSHRCAGIG